MRVQPYQLAIPVTCAALFAGILPNSLIAQQVTVRSPFQQNSSSFYENNSIAYSGNYRGITFSYGNPALNTPAFGGYQPGSGLSTNFALTGPNGRINFALNFSQGFKATSVNTTPEVTMMNGQTGYISDTSQTPFVLGVIPVVGGFPMSQQGFGTPLPQTTLDPRIQAMLQARFDAQNGTQDGNAQNVPQQPNPQPNAVPANQPDNRPVNPPAAKQAPGRAPVAQKAPVADQKSQDRARAHDSENALGSEFAEKIVASQASSAGRAAPSVAEARRMHEQEAAASGEDYAALLEKAKGIEEDGKPAVAKIYYQRVARHATGDLRREALERLEALKGGVSH